MASGGLEREKVEDALRRKGFAEDASSSDHNHYKLMHDGRYTGIFTKTSRGTKYRTLGPDLVTAMAKQIKLTTKSFREFVECTLTAPQYLEQLRQRDEL